MELLRGVIRDYDWGDLDAIAGLLGHAPPGHPEAEYWLGAHPSAPSTVIGPSIGLDRMVADDPHAMVGPAVWDRFSQLPYLLKILAARRPLSIQAHPSRDQAAKGFAREDEFGIARDAPNRNYRDDNHKPELICAVTRFEAKCGFRPLERSRLLINGLAAGSGGGTLSPLVEHLDGTGTEAEVLAETVAWLLGLPEPERVDLVAATVSAAAAADDWLLDEFGPEMDWVDRTVREFPGDVGVVVSLLLNHVTLDPGQAVFLRAGNLHSYLQGIGVELMANSDNVLRCGLTTKHIDIPELLSVVDYQPAEAPVQVASSPVHRFDSPIPEFALTRFDSTAGDIGRRRFDRVGPDIILVTSGSLAIERDGTTVDIPAGGAGFVSHRDGPYTVIDRCPGKTIAWRASVGAGFDG